MVNATGVPVGQSSEKALSFATDSLKFTVIVLLTATPVPPFDGVVEVTDGGSSTFTVKDAVSVTKLRRRPGQSGPHGDSRCPWPTGSMVAVLTFTVSEPPEAQAVNVSCRLAGLTTFATAVLLELTSIVSDSPESTLHCASPSPLANFTQKPTSSLAPVGDNVSTSNVESTLESMSLVMSSAQATAATISAAIVSRA